jgi:osmoprotectant transport system ATP-binding protein
MRRLAVTRIDPAHLEPMDGVVASQLAGTVDMGASLEDAMALLLTEDKSMVGVTEGARFLGVLTPNGIHTMLRDDVRAKREATPPSPPA